MALSKVLFNIISIDSSYRIVDIIKISYKRYFSNCKKNKAAIINKIYDHLFKIKHIEYNNKLNFAILNAYNYIDKCLNILNISINLI